MTRFRPLFALAFACLLLSPTLTNAQGTQVVGAFPQRMADRYKAGYGLPNGRVMNVATVGGVPVVQGEDGNAYTLEAGAWKRADSAPAFRSALAKVDQSKLPAGVHAFDAAVGKDGTLWLLTDRGAYRSSGDKYVEFTKPKRYLTRQETPNIDAGFTCVVVDVNGQVWFGTQAGVMLTDGADYWYPIDRRAGIPYEDVTALAFAPNGELWVGTSEGVCRFTKTGEWQYYWGPRWLPNNHVNAIAVDANGAAWVATDRGVAKLYDRPMRFEEKAKHYEEITAARHNRRGYVTDSELIKPGDPSGGAINEASDNDGLWTSVYVSAEAFRYAVTKDPEAKALAHKSMFAMLDLMRLTGVPGFPARAVMFKNEHVNGYSPDETVRIPGETEKIWFTSPVDPNILCKGDTSSDELDGHYFAWLNYYDLVADDNEKKAVREAVRACTDNIVNHGLYLFGHTGRRTLWGVWNPSFINDNPQWWEERGINSMEILTYLRVAYHVTNDPKYLAKYHELIEKDHYLINVVTQKVADPWWGQNHSDDEMSYIAYYCLMTLEHDPQTRAVLQLSLDRSWRVARPDHSPFFNFVYGSMSGNACDVEASVKELQSWPWELIDWEESSIQRTDAAFRHAVVEGRQRTETEVALPAAERHLMKWNGNPYEVSGGTLEGRGEEDGGAWLLPYWMGRYHHLIDEAK